MKYAGIIENDVVNGIGICVSFFTQGCPHRCEGCFNPETWSFNGGKEVPSDIEDILYNAITANGIIRNFSVLGGEPLCPQNLELVDEITRYVKARFPYIKIYLWTGYDFDELNTIGYKPSTIMLKNILNRVDMLITGRFILDEKDLTLPLRGSRNQQIWEKKDGKFILVEDKR